mmetsp:Transcript_67449/g.195329  ORF Transcript_67449/g.195329 Transcript_67449/m.195329 type:complete len:340 (+) Transcript_67449:617-1636(+)
MATRSEEDPRTGEGTRTTRVPLARRAAGPATTVARRLLAPDAGRSANGSTAHGGELLRRRGSMAPTAETVTAAVFCNAAAVGSGGTCTTQRVGCGEPGTPTIWRGGEAFATAPTGDNTRGDLPSPRPESCTGASSAAQRPRRQAAPPQVDMGTGAPEVPLRQACASTAATLIGGTKGLEGDLDGAVGAEAGAAATATNAAGSSKPSWRGEDEAPRRPSVCEPRLLRGCDSPDSKRTTAATRELPTELTASPNPSEHRGARPAAAATVAAAAAAAPEVKPRGLGACRGVPAEAASVSALLAVGCSRQSSSSWAKNCSMSIVGCPSLETSRAPPGPGATTA